MKLTYRYPEDGPPADLTVEGLGENVAEAIKNVAFGMFNALTPLEGIKPTEEFVIEAEGRDMESLIFNLMDEFLYLNDVEYLVASEIVLNIDCRKFIAIAYCKGEKLDITKHQTGVAIKAVTFHQMKITETDEGVVARVVFDT